MNGAELPPPQNRLADAGTRNDPRRLDRADAFPRTGYRRRVTHPQHGAGVPDDIVVLRQYHDEISAQLDAMVLEANGIPARVMADTGGGMIPSIAIVFPVRLLVHAENVDDARELLDTPVADDVGDAGDAEL